jgi:hypothetical protein
MDYDAEYSYHCACGERYSNHRAAWGCRKCRNYLREEDQTDMVLFERAPGKFDILRGFEGRKDGEWSDGEEWTYEK